MYTSMTIVSATEDDLNGEWSFQGSPSSTLDAIAAVDAKSASWAAIGDPADEFSWSDGIELILDGIPDAPTGFRATIDGFQGYSGETPVLIQIVLYNTSNNVIASWSNSASVLDTTLSQEVRNSEFLLIENFQPLDDIKVVFSITALNENDVISLNRIQFEVLANGTGPGGQRARNAAALLGFLGV